MDRSESALLEENARIRRAMRDLVALSALPAIWIGLGFQGIARSLANALLGTLSLDLIYIRLVDQARKAPVEVIRSRHHAGAAHDDVVKTSLASFLSDDRIDPRSCIPNPYGPGILQVAVTRFGMANHQGILIACSGRPDFPTEQDRLLLGVGANQTAIVIQRTQAEESVREQREWLQVTLASIGDAVITTDIGGKVAFLNAVAKELTGWTLDEAKGQPLERVFHIVNEGNRQPVENPVMRVLREGRVVGLANHTVLIAKDGTERPVDDSAAPILDSAGALVGVVMVFRSVAGQRRSEHYRNTRLAVTNVLNQAQSAADGTTDVLRAICENLNWDIGLFWATNNQRDRIVCKASWNRPDLRLTEFQTASSGHSFEHGKGIPGRVWASGARAWIQDLSQDTNFSRLEPALQCGLNSAFACPVAIGDETLGVLEFFSQRIREPDPDLLEMMGSIAAVLGQFLERQEAEDELRRSEQELAEFFENATVGLHWVGPDGTILRANRAELEMLGFRREEYIGRPIADFHVDEDVISDILAQLKAGNNLVDYPARLRCRDGSIKDVLIDSSVLWREGEFVHTRCFTRDVTERKRAEMALRDARSRLDAALDAGAIATWTWDIPNNRLYGDSNLALLFNLPPDEAKGGLLDKYIKSIHPDDLENVIAALNRSAEIGEDYEADYRVIQKDGSTRWVTARARVERDVTGRPVRMPGVLVDITERKRMEEALREAGRRKDEFLATLAHELRNPLAPIRTSLEILKMSRVDPETAAQARDLMERQVHALVRLVDDLLDVARVMRGKIELRKEPVELSTVVARAVETVRPIIDGQGHRLDLSIPDESLLLYADPVRLAQVIANLLTNSAKYTEAKGHIAISASREGDDAVLRIRDDGIGIAPEVLPHVFELFVQAEHASTKAQGGLGIGLTLARNLAQMHGGAIEAYSAGLGKGSEFLIRLPLVAPAHEEKGPTAGERLETQTPSTGRRLLVVDDNEDAAISFATLLRLQGHDVEIAHDGPTALKVACSFVPHMVFLDIGMPEMDGYQVARQMRRQPGLETVVLTALTGWGQEQDRRRTVEAGFNHHLVKPPEPHAIASILDRL